MAQQMLDYSDIHAPIEGVAGKGVAQDMGVYPPFLPCLLADLSQGFLLVCPAVIPAVRRLGPPGLHPVNLERFYLAHGVFFDNILHIQPGKEGPQGIDVGLDAAVLQMPFLA